MTASLGGRWPERWVTVVAIAAAFSTYFCMYAFRKPFSAATYEGLELASTGLALKTAFVIAQTIGYTLSKYLGVRVGSEVSRERAPLAILGCVGLAELALVVFALAPTPLKVAAIFANGLPLGLVWGFVVRPLEGRRTSELLLAGLSCSFIVASGFVKDAGRWLMQAQGVDVFWMPAATGLLFAGPLLLAVVALARVPPPSEQDEAERVTRVAMTSTDRARFLRRFWPGLALLLTAYAAVTAYRDYRDNYVVEILRGAGRDAEVVSGAISAVEIPVALGVMGVLALLSLVRDNRAALRAVFSVMVAGAVLVGASMALLEAGVIDGYWFLLLTGVGSYLVYVPFGSVLFDRVVAATAVAATAVFTINLADAIGYSGSVALLLLRDLGPAPSGHFAFFRLLSYALTALCVGLLVPAAWFFLARARRR